MRELLALVPFALLACSGASRGTFLVYEDGGADGGDDGGADATAGADAGSSGSCTPVSCFLGCCQGGTCIMPGTDTACGGLGQACRDCTSAGQRCQIGTCSGPRRGGSDAGPG